MLSGETASGNYPVQAVATMRRIVDKAERGLGLWGNHLAARAECVEGVNASDMFTPVPDAVSGAAVLIAQQVHAPAIICPSRELVPACLPE